MTEDPNTAKDLVKLVAKDPRYLRAKLRGFESLFDNRVAEGGGGLRL